MTIRQGSIVLACIPDRNDHWANHFCIVLNTNEELDAGEDFECVACSSKVDLCLQNGDPMVEVPWSSQGHPRTGFNKRTVAVCNWLVTVRKEDVIRVVGRAPTNVLHDVFKYLEDVDPQGSS